MDSSDHPLHDFYSHIHSSYDRVNRVFTFGRDVSWRRKAALECLRSGPLRILDLCTGTGDFILEVARHAKGNAFLCGYDFSREMLQDALRKYEYLKKKEGITAVEFVEGNVADMPFQDGHFDAIGITFGIRNLVFENSNAARHMEELTRVLRSGGRLVVLESSKPANPLWRIINAVYLRLILPYLGGVLSGNLSAYRYLARSSRNYYSIKEMGTILGDSGFRVLSARPLFLGSVMLVVAEKEIRIFEQIMEEHDR